MRPEIKRLIDEARQCPPIAEIRGCTWSTQDEIDYPTRLLNAESVTLAKDPGLGELPAAIKALWGVEGDGNHDAE
jgi:hypothetical protein